MGDILDVISTRQSIRRYTSEPIPDEMIDKILEAARWAPSGENEQPWKLIVVRDPETRHQLGEIARQGTGQRVTAEYCLGQLQPRFEGIKDVEQRESVMKFMYSGEVSKFPATAPLVIIVVGELKGMFDTPYDLSACIENMLLEAHSLGLGACWVHGPAVYPRTAEKLKKLLKIPTGIGQYKVLAMVTFGWPDGKRKHPRPKKNIEDIVYWEEFGRKERS
jgi:nitroreductase